MKGPNPNQDITYFTVDEAIDKVLIRKVMLKAFLKSGVLPSTEVKGEQFISEANLRKFQKELEAGRGILDSALNDSSDD